MDSPNESQESPNETQLSKPSLFYDTASYGLSWMYGKARGKLQSYWSTEFDAHPIDSEERVWLGSVSCASNRGALKALGVTHVVSAILGISEVHSKEFEYHIVPVRDVEWEQIGKYFHDTADFIETALIESPENRIFVHCVCGVSRSASLVASWLIKYRGYSAESAIEHLKSKRRVVDPNPGFIKQLKEFETSLN